MNDEEVNDVQQMWCTFLKWKIAFCLYIPTLSL